MYLVYTDETGTNFSEKSPYLLYGGLVVHESKINILETQLEQIIARFLRFDDLRKAELHAAEVFSILFYPDLDCSKKRKPKDRLACEALKERLKGVTVNDFIDFTNELIQFLTKMNVPLFAGIVNKNDPFHAGHRLNREVSAIAYAFKIFLNLIDRHMATKNEKALLIADDFVNQIPNTIASLPLYKRIQDKHLKTPNGAHKELVLLRVLYESMNWKHNITSEYESIAPLKYTFESKNLFVVDNINYTNSKDSILNQVADFVIFILRKVIEIHNNTEGTREDYQKLADQTEASLRFSMGVDAIILATIHKNDIILIEKANAHFNSFKDICRTFGEESNGR